MNAASIAQPTKSPRWMVVAMIAHAVLITAWWWSSVYARIDIPGITGHIWLPVALAWLGWPIYAIAKRRREGAVWAAVVVGALLIAPTASTIYVFAVWSIVGFAP